jgi:hypothetical protein
LLARFRVPHALARQKYLVADMNQLHNDVDP